MRLGGEEGGEPWQGQALVPLTVLRWSHAWLRVPQTLLPRKGPSTPNRTPCHYMLSIPAPTPVGLLSGGGAVSPTCSGTGRQGGADGPLRVPGLTAPLDAWMPQMCQGESPCVAREPPGSQPCAPSPFAYQSHSPAEVLRWRNTYTTF